MKKENIVRAVIITLFSMSILWVIIAFINIIKLIKGL